MSGQGPVPTAHALLVRRGAGVSTAPDGGAPGGVIRHSPPLTCRGCGMSVEGRCGYRRCCDSLGSMGDVLSGLPRPFLWHISPPVHLVPPLPPFNPRVQYRLYLVLCCFFHNLWRLGNQLFPSRNVIGMVRVQKGAVKDVVDLPLRGNSSWKASLASPTTFRILNGPNRLKSSFREGRVVVIFFRFNQTRSPTLKGGIGLAYLSNFLLYVSCACFNANRN
jgi:hypothetical protein